MVARSSTMPTSASSPPSASPMAFSAGPWASPRRLKARRLDFMEPLAAASRSSGVEAGARSAPIGTASSSRAGMGMWISLPMTIPPAGDDSEPEDADQAKRHPGGHRPVQQPARHLTADAATQTRIERGTFNDEAQIAALGALKYALQRARDTGDTASERNALTDEVAPKLLGAAGAEQAQQRLEAILTHELVGVRCRGFHEVELRRERGRQPNEHTQCASQEGEIRRQPQRLIVEQHFHIAEDIARIELAQLAE